MYREELIRFKLHRLAEPTAAMPVAPAPTNNGFQNIAACKTTAQNLSIREKITYQPASHFWGIQTIESAIFLAVAAALITIAVYAITRRRPV
jgi:hypothetical protein